MHRPSGGRRNAPPPSIRTLSAKLAADERWAKLDPAGRKAATAAGRKAAGGKFIVKAREMHPDASEAEIQACAERLRSAHFTRLALRSAQARRRKGGGGRA